MLGVSSNKDCESIIVPLPESPNEPVENENVTDSTNTNSKQDVDENLNPNINKTINSNLTNTNTTNDRTSSTPEINHNDKQNSILPSNNNSFKTLIIAAVFGGVGGVFLVLGGIFILKNSKFKEFIVSSKLSRSRPPLKLKIPIKVIDEATNSSHHNSPEMSRRRLSFRSNDSPVTTHHSPMKARLYTPSLFQSYSPERRLKEQADQEQGGFGIHIKPLGLEEDKTPDVEKSFKLQRDSHTNDEKIVNENYQEVHIRPDTSKENDCGQ